MGQQRGAIEIRGVVGGLQFGKNSDGSAGVKRARVFNKVAMKTGKNYARTRENNSEFKGSVKGAGALRLALGQRVRLFSDSQLFSRLVKLSYSMIQKGPGNKGERKLEAQANMVDFVGIHLHDTERFSSRFQASYTVTANTDRNTATLDVPAFDPGYLLTIPYGATDFSLILVAGVMSDFTHSSTGNAYAADEPSLAGKSVLVESAVMPVTGLTTALQLVATLPGSPVLPAATTLLVSLGIQFYMTVNNQALPLASGNAMQVVAAY